MIRRVIDNKCQLGVEMPVRVRTDRRRSELAIGDDFDQEVVFGRLARKLQGQYGGPSARRQHDIGAMQETACSPGNVDWAIRALVEAIADEEEIAAPHD